jgi:hypothetical protein
MSEWRRLARSVAYWTVPPGILDLCLGTPRPEHRRPSAGESAELENNVELQDKHRGQRVFILASGPSIKTQDLSVLRGEHCISVSNFFVHPAFPEIRPRYHCIAPLHPPFTAEDGARWFRQMDPFMIETTLLLGVSDKPLVQSRGLLTQRTVRYLNFSAEWGDRSNPEFHLSRPLPIPQSVSIMALMAALYLGFNEIFLLGTDHTFFNPADGSYDYQHFYADPKANALGKDPPTADLEDNFRCQATLWHQYKMLRAFAQSRGVTIYNASAGGILDLFPRVRLEEVAIRSIQP